MPSLEHCRPLALLVATACTTGADDWAPPRLPLYEGSSSSGTETEDPFGSTTEPIATDGSTTTGDRGARRPVPSDPCPSKHACIPAPPARWHGPVVTRAGAATCDAPFSISKLLVGRGVEAPTPGCTCTCRSTSVSPSCDPIDQATLVDATFDTSLTICGGAVVPKGACSPGELCVPLPSAGSICIWQDGDAPCPTPIFSRRSIWFRALKDDRGCTPCTCDGAPPTCLAAPAHPVGRATAHDPITLCCSG